MRILFFGFLSFSASLAALAHPMEVCLHRLSQSATSLKACQLAQDQPGQCDLIQSELNRRRQRCQTEGFVESDLDYALSYGLSQLQGDISQSPYAREVQKQRWENGLMRPNVENFKHYFPQYEGYMAAVMEDFNTAQCPGAYQGFGQKWQFVSAQTFKRYPLPESANPETQQVKAYFFAEQKEGQCYSPDPAKSEGGMAFLVANVPESLLLEISAQPSRVVRCESAGCLQDREQLDALHNRYESQYREYRNLVVCADIDLQNEHRRPIKGKKRSKRTLPEYCPQEEIQVKALNARGNLDQLMEMLFQDVKIGIETVKNE